MIFFHYLIQNSGTLFFLFSFPVFGHLICDNITKIQKQILLFLSITLALLRILGYRLEFIDLTFVIILILLASLYSFATKEPKWKVSITLTIVLVFIFGFLYFMSKFVGLVKTEQVWTKDEYKIELINERGFSGRPLYSYKLSKYYLYSTILKNCELLYDVEKTDDCKIIFNIENIEFDKCTNQITKLN